MIVITRSETQNWRKHWLVVNILAEIPIVGSFFKIADLSVALHDAGKCVAALAGGAAMMATTHAADTESILSVAKSTASMAAGMTVGKVIYNGVFESTNVLCFYFSSRRMGIESLTGDDTELQPIARPNDPCATDSPRLA